MKTLVNITLHIISLLFCNFSNAQLQFTNNGNFRIHNGATVSFYGDFVNNGAFIDSGLVSTLKGTSPQQIGGSALTTFKNLSLDNSAGSYLTSNEAITGELDIVSGTFSTTGYDFTLISDANGTARIAPIQGNFSGNITMQRYMGVGPTDWRFLASPVSGGTINDWQDDFVTSGFPGSTYPSFPFVSIYTYDETVAGISDYGYNVPTSASDPITPGVGYWCYVGPTPVTVDVTGPPTTFNHTFSVTYSPNAGNSEDGYVMVGNPYPSPIDWTSAAWIKNNINDAVYIWNPVMQQYASWVSGVATNGGSNVIASSQSFWIQTNGSNPQLESSENVKVSSSQPFLKSSSQNSSASSTITDNLKLIISGNNYVDETILQFTTEATNGYDASLDARKLFSSNANVPGISTQDSTLKDLSINSLPPLTALIHIPVKTLVGVSGNYTIAVDSNSYMNPDFCLVLEDRVTGIKTPLENLSSYSFDIMDTTKTTRFILHVSPAHQTKPFNVSCNNYQDGKIITDVNGVGPWNYLWYTSGGAIFKQTLGSFSNDSIYNLNPGTYSVQISDASGMCKSVLLESSVIQTNQVYAGFTLRKDTLYTGVYQNVIFQNNSFGATTYTWNFGDGSPEEFGQLPQYHVYAAAGNYQVNLIAQDNGCSDTLNKVLVVLPANLANIMQSNLQNEITFFPNPNNGVFHINSGSERFLNTSLEIRSVTGAMVYKENLNGFEKEINLQDKAKGIYFYTLTFSSQKIYKGKLVVE